MKISRTLNLLLKKGKKIVGDWYTFSGHENTKDLMDTT